MTILGYTQTERLSGQYVKGWVARKTPGGRWFIFDNKGRFMIWGTNYTTAIKAATKAGEFLISLSKGKPSDSAARWFVDNLSNLYLDLADYNRAMSFYLNPSKGWDLTRFCRTMPGFADEPELIAPAILATLSCAPFINPQHYREQLASLRAFAYSLPKVVRDNPADFNELLWLEYDKLLDSPAAVVTAPVGGIPQTLEYWLDRREKAVNELADIEAEIVRLGGST